MNWKPAKLLVGALVVLLGAGTLHRWVHHGRAIAASDYRALPLSLSEVPSQLGSYTLQQDLPLAPETQQVAGVDSFLYREYTSSASPRTVFLYVGYWGRQNTGMGHGPEVCYPAVGWKVDEGATQRVIRVGGSDGASTEMAIAIHHFVRAEPEGIRRVAVGFAAVADGEWRTSSRGVFRHGPPGSPDEGFLAHIHVSTPVVGTDWSSADSSIVDFTERVLPHVSKCLLASESTALPQAESAGPGENG